MKNLSDLAGEPLIIRQPSIFENYYELKYGEEILGSIQPDSFFKTSRVVYILSNQFEFYHPHFFSSEIAIKEALKELPYAKYKNDRFKFSGTVYLPRGERFKLIFRFFKGAFSIQTVDSKILASYNYYMSIKEKTTVKIEQESKLLDTYPWIIFLAWYLAVYKKLRYGKYFLSGG
jgi:hypothetical protein